MNPPPDVTAALHAFDTNTVSGEDVVRAEHALPLDDLLSLWHRLNPAAFPDRAAPAPLNAHERLELTAGLEGRLGESAWGLPIDSVAEAWVLAGDPARAFSLRLRALARTPRWDSVLAARQLLRVAGDLRARGEETGARVCEARAARFDSTVVPGPVALEGLEPLDEDGLINLLIHDDHGAVLGDHLALPRRKALACIRRGVPAMGRLPLWATRRWEPTISATASALRLGAELAFESGDANNARLLAAIEGTPAGAEAVRWSKKKAGNPYSDNEVARIKHYEELATMGDWVTVRRGLLTWRRQARLSVAAILTLEGDTVGEAYVVRAAALAAELSHDGSEVGSDWALPRKVLARRAGDATVTWR